MHTMKNTRRAQGLTEYLIVIVLVGIAVLAATRLFGSRVMEKQVGADVKIDMELRV